MITDARVLDLCEDNYRPLEAWSISQLKLLPKRPELFYGFFVADPPLFEFDETADMLFGTACHADFLEGKQCTEIPAEVLASNGQRRGKAWDAYKESHSALECLSRKEVAAVQAMRKSCESQPRIANLLWGEGKVELPILGRETETGLDVKGKLDKLRVMEQGLIVVDLKITSINPDEEREVSAKCHAMGYVQQAAFYYDLVEAAYGEPPMAFIFCFCRNKPPYTARLWEPSELDLDWGRRRNRVALFDLKRRLDSGDWSGERHNRVNHGPENNLVPKWAFTDDPADCTPAAFAEFMQFATTFAQAIQGD